MSVDDPDKKPLNQTRFGTPTGHANERQMLDSRDDTFGIRTIVKQNGDGTETLCRTHAGMPRFTTDELPSEEETADTCPLTDVGFVNSTYSVGAYPSSERFDWKLYNLFSSAGAVKTAKYARNSTGKKEQLMWKAAPLYSGLMRRVIQVHNGKADESVLLQPGWAVSDGLFIGVGNYGKVTRYVIRIDSSGIWRIPVKFCKDLSSTWQTDEATWRSTLSEQAAHDKIAPYWTMTKLSVEDKVQIGSAPSCFADSFGPFYDWCGWAFNYTGTAATVVCLGVVGSNPWLTTRLYDIQIQSSEGIPVSATTAITEESMLANPRNDTVDGAYSATLQTPVTLPGYLATFSFYNAAYGTTNQDAPVFSYYESSGAKVVVRYKYVNGTTITTSYTQTHQTPGQSYITPVGTIAATGLVGGVVTTFPVEVYPEPGFLTYDIGPVRSVMTGGSYGTVGPCVYSGHVSTVGESHTTPSRVDLDLVDAGFGYTQNGSDLVSGRGTFGRLLWCVLGASVYGDDKPLYPWPAGEGPSVSDPNRYVSFVLQKTTTYQETLGRKSTLLLHGFDRESYAVATWESHITSTKTSNGDTAGPLAGLTCIPSGGATILTNTGRVSLTAVGITLSTRWTDTATYYTTAIGGWEYQPSIEGKVVCISTYTPTGGFATETKPPINDLTRTLYVRVGESTKVLSLGTDQLFRNYTGVNLFMFRACAAAWNPARIVYSEEATSPLATGGMGGIKPSSNITTFIGVF